MSEMCPKICIGLRVTLTEGGGGGVGVFKPPLEIPQGPPKSCQTQPDCENC